MLKVTKDGFETYTKRFTVSRGASQKVAVRLEPKGPDDRTPRNTTATDPRTVIEQILDMGGTPFVRRNKEEVPISEENINTTEPLVAVRFAKSVNALHLDRIKSAADLETIAAPGSTLSDRSFEALNQFRALQRLDLRETTFDHKLLRLLPAVLSLRQLDLSLTYLQDEDLAHLSALRRVEVLNIEYADISAKGLTHLIKCKSLHELGLSFTTLKSTDLEPLTKMSRLRLVRLVGARSIDDRGCEILSNCPVLGSISLDSTEVTNEGLRHLATMERLEALGICNTAVDDDGLKLLARSASLRLLGFNGSAITHIGLSHIALLPLEMLHLPNFKGLNKEGIAIIGNMQALRSLNVSGTRIEDEDITHLVNLKKLTFCDLQNTNVTDAGAQRLRKSLPSCNVQW